ncbi:MAG: SLBB domain-containing protein [Deltaproteobacteria bacterium]|nr:SLBB domain-containing protein [Deltaproteobacteria bacterium]
MKCNHKCSGFILVMTVLFSLLISEIPSLALEALEKIGEEGKSAILKKIESRLQEKKSSAIKVFDAELEEIVTKFQAFNQGEKIKFFQELDELEKPRIFSYLKDDDKVIIFESLLDESERMRLFEQIEETEQETLFNQLSEITQITFFQVLSDEDKKRLFNSITSQQNRLIIFSSLETYAQVMIFKELDEQGREFLLKYIKEEDRQVLLKAVRDAGQMEWLLKYPDEGAPSEVEKILSGRFPTDITPELRQFGYDFFKKDMPSGISSFVPSLNVPVGPDYIIGPGDGFTINLWGKTEEKYEVTVKNDGSITLPRLGNFNVSGLTYNELKGHLNSRFREIYQDFDMSITMDILRTIMIFVVGEASKPGTYSVSSLSTVLTALFEAGGPTKNGSLRNVRLIRDGEEITTLDLYDFFIRGLKTTDIRLQPGDTIFIPVIGPVAGVAGCVKRPAIYEFHAPKTIADIIVLAGGILPMGYLQNVVVERMKDHKLRVIKSFNLDPSSGTATKGLEMPVRDGDLIKIYPIHKELQRVVYLEGHVKYPGERELKEGMRLRDIIQSHDFLLPEPFLPQAEIIRLSPTERHPAIINFNLGALLDGDEDQNLELKDQDRVRIYDAWEKQDVPQVTIKGAVRNPGTYRLYRGMTVKDLIFAAGNLTDKAFTKEGGLTRLMIADRGVESLQLEFSPRNAMRGDTGDNPVLQKNDIVHIREIPQYSAALEQKVTLEGEFMFPGEYMFSYGERLSSVINRAGGLTDDAFPYGSVFTRLSVKETQKRRLEEYTSKLEKDIIAVSSMAAGSSATREEASILGETLRIQKDLVEKLKTAEPGGRMVIDLEEVLLLPSSGSNFELRPGDKLVVNKRPDSINVMGEVFNPTTTLLAEKGRDVDYYLSRVGGVTDRADKKQIYVVKANGTVYSRAQAGMFGFGSWDDDNKRWAFGRFQSMELDPGDTIIVPQKIVTFSWMRALKDTSEILYRIAVAVGVVDRLFD